MTALLKASVSTTVGVTVRGGSHYKEVSHDVKPLR